jgi:hypothetical protein
MCQYVSRHVTNGDQGSDDVGRIISRGFHSTAAYNGIICTPPQIYDYLPPDVATDKLDHEDFEKLSHRLSSSHFASEW